MKAYLNLAASGLALALASTAASAQTVISRSINAEPVETTVTQTPTGTVVTRRPLAQQPAPLVAPQVAAPALVQPTAPPPALVVQPPILAADEVMAAPIMVGTVLPANVPLYAIPENVALSVPATQSYSYAYLGGRAYLVDPASGTVVADVTE